MSAVQTLSKEYDCLFENRQMIKVFLHRATTETDILDEFILGEKFQVVLLDKGKYPFPNTGIVS